MKVGDEVICVDGSAGYVDHLKLLQKDKMYIIRGTAKPVNGNPMNVLVEGIVGYWHCTRFRKVDKKPFTNSITKELASNPIVEERIEKIEEHECA